MKKLFFAVLLSAIIAGLVYFSGLGSKDEPEKKDDRLKVEESGATVTIKNFRQVTRDKGKVSGILEAELALIFPEKQLVKLVKPELTYFNRDGEKIIVEAGEGDIDMVSKNVNVSGGVVIISSDYRFKTSDLNYNKNENKIISKDSVTISGGFSGFKADRMIIDLNDTKIEFTGNVKGYFSETE